MAEIGDNTDMNWNDLTMERLIDYCDDGESAAAYELAVRYDRRENVETSAAKAAFYFNVAAELGDRRANLRLAEKYLAGDGVAKNAKTAKHHFEIAGRAGIACAETALGMLTEGDTYVATETNIASENDLDDVALPEFARHYRAAANGGDAEGQYRYANFLLNYTKNEGEAKKLLIESEKNGFAAASTAIGKMERKKGKYVASATHFKLGAERGDPEAVFCLARQAELGEGIARDEKAAYRGYREAYRSGIRAACFPLARFLFEGTAGEKNFVEAERLLKKAAELKLPEALTYFGKLSEHGKFGIAQDEIAAAERYREAYLAGDAEGAALYGKMLILGIGAERDYELAYKVIAESAEKNCAEGLYFLGYMKEKGFGTPIDFRAAAECYDDAAKRGSKAASARRDAIRERTV